MGHALRLSSSRRRLVLLVVPILLLLLVWSFSQSQTFISPAWRLEWHQLEPCHLPESSDCSEVLDGPYREDAPPEHAFLRNGLLSVNPEASSHPIAALISHARRVWDAKLARASTTLDDAVAEYERRRRRPPPLGFDRWWAYTQEHSVQLPDEYDVLHEDLAPFYGIAPADLARLVHYRADYARSGVLTLTIGKEDVADQVRLLSYNGPETTDKERKMAQRFRNHVEGNYLPLLRPVQHLLPPFKILVSPHDSPPFVLDWDDRERFVDAGARGDFLDIDPALGTSSQRTEWPLICPLSSPARSASVSPSSHNKSFIHDHRPVFSPCSHPSLLSLSGAFLETAGMTRAAPAGMPVPMLMLSAPPGAEGIRVGSLYQWVDVRKDETGSSWEEKRDELIWRGSTTGAVSGEATRWRLSQRFRLVALANGVDLAEDSPSPSSEDATHTMSVLEPSWSTDDTAADFSGGQAAYRPTHDRTLPRATANSALSVSFVGTPVQCRQPVCDTLKELFHFEGRMKEGAEREYKYLLDVDGNGWSGRFKRLIGEGSLVFKATVYPEWFSDRIQPWVHYVPLQMDYSDLYDILFYFRGIPSDSDDASIPQSEFERHDGAAREIAEEGQKWSNQFWRKEDMTAYLFRLILEYNRLMSEDRDGESYRSNPL